MKVLKNLRGLIKPNKNFYMKIQLTFITFFLLANISYSQTPKYEWVSTTKNAQWVKQEGLNIQKASGKADVEILRKNITKNGRIRRMF